MIKFFRKIRQRLITKNKFSKYLLYALGEIILVVIGILIALQINNWNIKNQALIEIESNFKNLIEDIESNKVQLLNLIEEREKVMNSTGILLNSYENQVQVTENEFLAGLTPVISEKYFEINKNDIDKVTQSSAFELEEVESIRDLIKSYLFTRHKCSKNF